MPIVEYESGAAFPGVIGRTADVSSPPGRPRSAPARTHPTCCSSCWTTRASANSAVTALRSARRTSTAGGRRAALQQLPHDGALLAHALVPRDRAQPPLQRHGLHHRRRHRLSRQQWDDPLRERLSLGDPAPATATARYAVGKWHLTPGHRDRRPDLMTAGRWAAASSASTASWAATRTSTIRSWSTTTTRSSRRRRPKRATTSPRTWSTRPSASSPTPSRSTRQAVLPLFRHRRHARAASCAQGMGRQVQGPVRRRLGCLSREDVCPPEGAGRHSG